MAIIHLHSLIFRSKTFPHLGKLFFPSLLFILGLQGCDVFEVKLNPLGQQQVNASGKKEVPVAQPIQAKLNEDSSLTIALDDADKAIFKVAAVSDSKIKGELTYSIVTQPQSGSLNKSQGSSVTYTPNPNFHGNDSFTYQVSDGSSKSEVATVKLEIIAVNDAPTLTEISPLNEASEDTPFNISYTRLSSAANAADVDGNILSFKVEAVVAGTLTKNGTEVIAGTLLDVGESFVWTPPASTSGAIEAFKVSVFDGALGSVDDVLVTVNVEAGLTLTLNQNTTTKSNGVTYTVTGGVPPYSLNVTQGTLSNLSGSGTFMPESTGSAVIAVSDADSNTRQKTVTINSQLMIAAEGPQFSNFARGYHGVAEVSQKYYSFAGYNSSFKHQSDLRVYDPSIGAGGAWRTLSPAGINPTARNYPTVFSIDEKLYAWGGYNHPQAFGDMFRYDPESGVDGTWTKISPTGAPSNILGNAVVPLGKVVYSFFGDVNNVSYTNIVYKFDPQANTITQLFPTGTIPTRRHQGVATVLNGKIYYFGGYTPNGPSFETFEYDPTNGNDGAWRTLTPSGTPHNSGWDHTAVAIGNLMYVFGGHAAPYSNFISQFDPEKNSGQGEWKQLNPSGSRPGARAGAFSALVNGSMIMYGGTNNNILSDVISFTPSLVNDGNIGIKDHVYLHKSLSVSRNSNSKYHVTGGVPPYTISTTAGALSSTNASGSYTAPATASSATIKVTDAAGKTSTLTLTTP